MDDGPTLPAGRATAPPQSHAVSAVDLIQHRGRRSYIDFMWQLASTVWYHMTREFPYSGETTVATPRLLNFTVVHKVEPRLQYRTVAFNSSVGCT